MFKFDASEYVKQRPGIQMTAMIDIMFINLLFFMALFVYFNFESELNISVPKAETSKELQLSPGEIIVNILKDGTVVVNQKTLTTGELEALLKKTTEVYPGQAVIVRADEKAYHENVIRVIDTCAKAKIWNISFAASREIPAPAPR
jgi:biopolymer transport protein ExbD